MIDQDGDKRISRFSLTIDGKMIPEPITEGTGKYEGMEMNGSVGPLGPFPDIKPGMHQDCSRQTGTYKLKQDVVQGCAIGWPHGRCGATGVCLLRILNARAD